MARQRIAHQLMQAKTQMLQAKTELLKTQVNKNKYKTDYAEVAGLAVVCTFLYHLWK